MIDVVGVTIFVLLSSVIFQAIFGPGRFTGHQIIGAFLLYLNIGLMFKFLHRLVADTLPGAYANLPLPDQGAAFRAATVYFSFSSLTSVGYGDIVPIAPIARSLAILESMIGQLLPATLLARVVALAMKARDDRTISKAARPVAAPQIADRRIPRPPPRRCRRKAVMFHAAILGPCRPA